MVTIKREIIDIWKKLVKNSQQIRKLTKENKKLMAKFGKHIRSRSAWRTMKKGKGN